MHKNFLASLMILGVVSTEGNLMPPHFFLQGGRVNVVVYSDVLKLWIIYVESGRPYVFQQDSALSHTAPTTQQWVVHL